MKEVSSTGTLSGQGQCSDPCKLAPDPTECVCVCVSAAPQPQTVDKTARILWQNIKAIRWRCLVFLWGFLQHMQALGSTIKMFGSGMQPTGSWTQGSVDCVVCYLNNTYDFIGVLCIVHCYNVWGLYLSLFPEVDNKSKTVYPDGIQWLTNVLISRTAADQGHYTQAVTI